MLTARNKLPTGIDMAEHNQQFDTFVEWKNKASSWLTRRWRWEDDYENRAVCFDAQGRVCSRGGHFMRADQENTFPVRWLWPEQIAEVGNEHPFFKQQKEN